MENKVLIKYPKSWGLDEKTVRKFSLELLKKFGFDNNTELSVMIVGRKKAKELNIKYRQKDYIPQVLGFPMSKETDVDGFRHLGDIVICSAKLKYESKYQNKSIEKVLFEWLEHGLENLMKG